MGLLGLDGVAMGGLGCRKENEFQDAPETACFAFFIFISDNKHMAFYSGG